MTRTNTELVERLLAFHDTALEAMPDEHRQYRAPEQLAERAALEAQHGRLQSAREGLDRARNHPDAVGAAAAIALQLVGDARFDEARPFAERAESQTATPRTHAQLFAVWTVLGNAARANAHHAQWKRDRTQEYTNDARDVALAMVVARANSEAVNILRAAECDPAIAAPAVAVVLGRQDTAAAEELAQTTSNAVYTLAIARSMRGEHAAVLALAERDHIPHHVEEAALLALVDGGRREAAVTYLRARYEHFFVREENLAAATTIAMQLARLEPASACSWVRELVAMAAEIRAAAFLKVVVLASLAEAARRCGVDATPIVKAAKTGTERYGVALGLVMATDVDAPDWVQRTDEARALAGKLKGSALENKLLLATALHAGRDTAAARRFLDRLKPSSTADAAPASVGGARIDCGDEEAALRAVTVGSRLQRSTTAQWLAIHATTRRRVELALQLLASVDAAARAQATLDCVRAITRPELPLLTRLSTVALEQ